MEEYKILPEVSINEIPESKYSPHSSKWLSLLDPLPFDKAIPFECETAVRAKRLRGRIKQAMIRVHPKFKIHYRRFPSNPEDRDGKCILYVWKEKGQ